MLNLWGNLLLFLICIMPKFSGNFATLATVPSRKPTDVDLLGRGSCGPPTTYPDMYLTDQHLLQTEFTPGTEVRYTCLPGYRRIRWNKAVSRCVGGQWTPINLKCERKSCGSAGEILNGHFEYKGILFGDTVSAVCDVGYELIGRNYKQCQDQGWDGSAPVCEAVKCGDPPEVVNGERMGPQEGPFVYSTVIRYWCRQGQLIGDREIHCMQDGTWSASPPQCRSSIQDHADITCQSPSVTNGVKIKGQARVYNKGHCVTFNCTRGFSLTGSREITCGPNGQWQPQVPKCLLANVSGNFATLATVPSRKPTDVDLLERGSCGPPTTYPDMYLTDQHLLQTEFTPGTEVRYTCLPGYRRIRWNKAVSRCVGGQWTPINLKCERKSCGSAGEFLNGHYDYKGILFGDTVSAVCDVGYEMIGRNYRQCQDQGWDGSAPVCEAVKCGDPPEVVNGERMGPQEGPFVYSTVIRYWCRQGQLIGDREIHCMQDGTWSASPPQCRSSIQDHADITCQSPSVTNGVKIKGQARVYNKGHCVTFNCTRGFSLTGSREITCGPNGQWQPQVPKCLLANVSGNFATLATVPSRKPTDVDLLERGSCGPPTTYPDMYLTDQHLLQTEFTPGTEVRYTCLPGYRRIRWNKAVSRCVGGQWTPINLKCERKSCGSAGEFLNGHYDYKGILFGDTVSAVCDVGYEMIGRNYRQCQDQGWDGSAPVCEAVKCGDPPEVVNGERTGPQEGPFVYSTVIRYWCRQGQLIGDREIHCMQDGTWNASPPQCKSITCTNPYVEFGTRTSGYSRSYKYRDFVSFKCNKNYLLSGPSKVKCELNGKWTPSLPKCRYRGVRG